MAKLRYSVPDTPHIFSRLNVSTDGMKLVFVQLSPGDEHTQFMAITTYCNNPKPILQQVINTSLPDSPVAPITSATRSAEVFWVSVVLVKNGINTSPYTAVSCQHFNTTSQAVTSEQKIIFA